MLLLWGCLSLSCIMYTRVLNRLVNDGSRGIFYDFCGAISIAIEKACFDSLNVHSEDYRASAEERDFSFSILNPRSNRVLFTF